MQYCDVCLETFGYALPPQVVSSSDLEGRLAPCYERLRLPEGRLELMTGIRERRFWEKDTLPSQAGAQAGRHAMDLAGFGPDRIDCLLNCSVSRDFVEPATATSVHRLLGLPGHALNFDISNACLGLLSGMVTVANMIQLGQIRTGLVVAGENAGPLVETTIRALNSDTTLSRREIKPYFASLTIGSVAAAALLTHRDLSRSGHRLLGGAHFSNTNYNHLCQGDVAGGMSGDSAAMMQTDSEELLVRGVEVAEKTWSLTEQQLQWTPQTPDLICSHQVGRAHTELLFRTLGLDMAKNFSTFEFLGNCGSASVPVTAAMAAEKGLLKAGDRLALLGIGSGINCMMLGIEW